MKKIFFIVASFVLMNKISAQSDENANNGIYQSIQALNTFSRVLFVTMKPGDEDAQLISYLSKHEHYDVGLLTITRGERMKNYAGYETAVDEGIIHAQEMLKASEISGFEPMATSLMDAGEYDSSASLFNVWDKDKLLSNIVWSIRDFRPDMIIVPDKNNSDSANEIVLQSVIEANEKAADKNYYPVQLAGRFNWLQACSAKEIFIDLSDSSTEDKNNCVPVFSNITDESNGLTYKEIAQQSYMCERSIFKDLNNIPLRKDTQYLKPLLQSSGKRFTQNDTDSANKGYDISSAVNNILQQFNFLRPENSLPLLTDLYKQVQQSDMQEFWKKIKLAQLQNIILRCAGTRIKAFTDKPFGVKGKYFPATVRVINNLADLHISDIQIGDSATVKNIFLPKQSNYSCSKDLYISFDRNAYQPFWLNNPIDFEHASYHIDDTMTDRLADTACFTAVIHLSINNLPLTIKLPVVYQNFDRMNGEINEPFYTVEPILVSQSPVVLLTNISSDTKPFKNTSVTLKFRPLFDSAMYTILQVQEVGKFVKNKQGIVTSEPRYLYHGDTLINFKNNDAFKINIPFSKNDDATSLTPSVLMRFPEGGQSFDADLKEVTYPYIPTVIYNFHDQTTVINDEIKTRGKKVAYLFGLRDDAVDMALHQLGYKPDFISLDEELQTPDSLKNYDAIIIGNYLPLDNESDSTQINAAKFNLDGYVYHGGSLISLSNNELNGLLPLHLEASAKQIAQSPDFKIFKTDDSVLLTYPNKTDLQKIAAWQGPILSGFAADFDGKYTPVLKVQIDNRVIYPLLSASLGSGKMIYCNLDLSLQTMNAQPDAFKLLANLIAAKYKNKDAHPKSSQRIIAGKLD